MLGFLKSMLIDDRTRKVLEQCAAGPPPPGTAAPPAASRPAAPRPASREMTPERDRLIKEAIATRRAKQQILDHLSDDDRAKLVVMAMSALLGQLPEQMKNHGRKRDR